MIIISLPDLIHISHFLHRDTETLSAFQNFLFFHSLQIYRLVCLMSPSSSLSPTLF